MVMPYKIGITAIFYILIISFQIKGMVLSWFQVLNMHLEAVQRNSQYAVQKGVGASKGGNR